jgi:flavoprotein
VCGKEKKRESKEQMRKRERRAPQKNRVDWLVGRVGKSQIRSYGLTEELKRVQCNPYNPTDGFEERRID